jgi:polyhydroxybutyrate depolymerase
VIVVATLASVVVITPAHASSAAAAGGSKSCKPQAAPEPSTQTIDVDGVARQYRVAMPARAGGKGLRPLILNFHGSGRDDVTQAAYSELEEKGPARGFVVITPNAGNPAFWTSRDPALATVRDANLAFTTALIDSAVADLCVDPPHVYATGFSAGAAMSADLGCTLGRQFAAIAPVSGVNLAAPCPGGKPMSVVAFHGTADPEVPYEGGTRQSLGGETIENPSVEAAVRVWAQRAECQTKPSSKSIGTEVERIAYRGCGSSTDVVLYKVVNGKHNWPGSFELDDLGLPTKDINAADLILDFFSHHPRPAKTATS